jgi:hypothetical protein
MWPLLLLSAADALIKFIPTFAAAMVLWLSMTRATSPWALPITLAAVPAAFHVYLLATGTTLADAQDAGWVLKPEVGFMNVWLWFCGFKNGVNRSWIFICWRLARNWLSHRML